MKDALRIGLIAAAVCTPAALAEPLDHFKCYPASTERETQAPVYLRDQFGDEEAVVLGTRLFCNPATKIYADEVTPIGNPAAHLQLYEIVTEGRPRPRKVVVGNQLRREQPLEVGAPVFLAVPTAKVERWSNERRGGLDHFKCYEAEGEPLGVPVALKDQFDFERDLEVVAPRLLCNPTEKRHRDRVSRIRNPEQHLVCYGLGGARIDASAETRNQFGSYKLGLEPAELLCVPSSKRQEGDEPPGEDPKRPTDAGLARALPPTVQCDPRPTGEFVVTGSETQVSGDEHCFPSDGTGNFGPRVDILGLTTVDGMDVADMDGDGDHDFLACDGPSGEVYLYTQGPPAVFSPTSVASGVTTGVGGSFYCTYLRVADFDGDGQKDFVVGDNRVTRGMYVYLQGPPGTFARVLPGLDVSWASPTGAQCNCLFGVAAGDVDGDGSPDVLVLGYRGSGTGEVHFYRGDGLGGMDPPVLKFNVSADFPVVAAPTGIALFDAEGDGDLDVIVGGSSDGTHYVYANDGVGNFAPPGGAAFDVDNYTGVDGFEVDGDGDDDLVLVDWTGFRLLYSENLGGVLAAPTPEGNLRGPSIGIGAPHLEARPPGGRLDHFKCYRSLENAAADAPVDLQDQFGSARATVLDSARFCTPVAKLRENDVTDIRDPAAHLTFYRLEVDAPTEPRRVAVSNQFVDDWTLEVTRPAFLAVPSQKHEPRPHPAPRNLDHFQCYEAAGEKTRAVLLLRDQFGAERQIQLLEPRLLCNPVQKKHRDEVTEIRNPEDHLVCYGLEGTRLQATAQWSNQFREHASPLDPADLLCVPSRKEKLR